MPTLCAVCGGVRAPYKCPGCRTPFCSVACGAAHKPSCAPAPATGGGGGLRGAAVGGASTAASGGGGGAGGGEEEKEEEDDELHARLPRDRLERLLREPRLAAALRDPRLRRVLAGIDAAPDRVLALDAARRAEGEPLREFFDDVLVALGVARRVPLEGGRWGVEFEGLA
jgi:hypothetical protein